MYVIIAATLLCSSLLKRKLVELTPQLRLEHSSYEVKQINAVLVMHISKNS